jgi:hypothetical protein
MGVPAVPNKLSSGSSPLWAESSIQRCRWFLLYWRICPKNKFPRFPYILLAFGKMFRGFLYSWKHFTLREYVRDLPTIGLHRCPKIISLISPILAEFAKK